MENETFSQMFPLGQENTAYAKYFSGKSWLARLTQNTALNVPVANVTFEPACRNNWHSHTGGQILVATAGKGFYQEKGKPAQLLRPGDIVEIAPNVVHWHGAAPDSWFAHLAIECNPQTNENTWLEPVDDAQYRAATAPFYVPAETRKNSAAAKNLEKWFPQGVPARAKIDPEIDAVFESFAFGEVFSQSSALDDKTRVMATLASCIALQAVGEYETLLDAAQAVGVSPIEIKEILYQAIPYVGFAKVAEFVPATDAFLAKNGNALPLSSRATTSPETRFEKGLAKQIEIFGDRIRQGREAAPADQKHIQDFLSANCFGDYVVRDGLDSATRELLTFSMLVSLGGCDPQVKGHIAGNLAVGNDREKLIAVATQLLPYIGYPRTLNALAALNEVVPAKR